MPRANRYHVQGLIWHITHRCHDREFLLKFNCDRKRYRHWLYEATKRYGLRLLNFNLTSNHVHLLVHDEGLPGVLEKSLQLVEGRVAQQYNCRKGRLGAFWQDRYHATAIQSGRHLRNCFTYIDLNMVRAGKVRHPSQWPSCGYHEIQRPRKQLALLDLELCARLLGMENPQALARWQISAIDQKLDAPKSRDSIWTESVAVGDVSYLEDVIHKLGARGRFKKIRESGGQCFLEEEGSRYGYWRHFPHENPQ